MDIFIHLPRTGGTSISNSLIMQYGISSVYRCEEISLGVYKTRRHIDFRKPCLVMGHVPLGVHVQLGAESARYFTMIREPFSRLVSHYNYVIQNKKHYLHRQVVDKKMSFEQYISSNLSGELSNGLVRQLSGHTTSWDCAPDFNELYDLTLAKLNQFSAIGIMEEFSLSMELFCAQLGWEIPPYVMQENSSNTKELDNFSYEQCRELVCAKNEKDVMLYKYIHERFKRDTENLTIASVQSASKLRVMLSVNMHRLLEWD